MYACRHATNTDVISQTHVVAYLWAGGLELVLPWRNVPNKKVVALYVTLMNMGQIQSAAFLWSPAGCPSTGCLAQKKASWQAE